MRDFCFWFLNELPAFLMTEPIKYFVGFGLLIFAVHCFLALTNYYK